jgi:hypothetical protein
MEMAYRSQTTGCLALLTLACAPTAFGQRELRFEVRHDHWWGSGAATLTIGERGISFEEPGKEDKLHHAGSWIYDDIQELKLLENTLVLVTYQDRKWRLGADRQHTFNLAGGDQTLRPAYALLKDRLDQRFVVALADPDIPLLWEIPVKLLGSLAGSEGMLRVGTEHIVYATESADQSRTWSYRDIENIGTSGPFQLTLTTYERAKLHYGSRKSFNFQLKQPLAEERYDQLWRRLNRTRALPFLTASEEAGP